MSAPAPAATVTVVVVNYNVAGLLAECLASVQAAATHLAAPVGVVVVDNASADGSAAMVRECFPRVRLIVNTENRGFGAACNQGAAEAGECVMFLNPDARIEPGALAALVARLRETPAAGVVGPLVTYPGGAPQETRRRFPGLLTLLLESTPVQWRAPGNPVLRRYHYGGEPVCGPERVDWLSAAGLLVRTSAFRQAGGFDPAFFMYFEETDLCRRLAALGWETWFEPAARCVHHHGQSAARDPAARDRRYFTSKQRYLSRYWGERIASLVGWLAVPLFAFELAIHLARRDAAAARRYARLVAGHLKGWP